MADWNPYQLAGGVMGTDDPIAIHFSGGRSSAYMVRQIQLAHGGEIPDRMHILFTNTGRERDETLDFVRDVSGNWRIPITWLERDFEAPEGYREVGHNSAKRRGEWGPFDALIERKKFLPNAVNRFCTQELKIVPATKWMRAQGYDKWASVLGYRADEAHRLLKARANDIKYKAPDYALAPMVDAGVTKRDVAAFWAEQPFDLALPLINNATPTGNCDGCFLHSASQLGGFARVEPGHMGWWTRWEARFGWFRPPSKKMTHTQIASFIRDQGDLLDPPEEPDAGIDCFCTE